MHKVKAIPVAMGTINAALVEETPAINSQHDI